MSNKNLLKVALLFGVFLSGSALASIPPQPASHPTSYFSNQTDNTVVWTLEDHGYAVSVLNHPANPIEKQSSGVRFDFRVHARSFGDIKIAWGAGQSCTFDLSGGGVNSVSTPSTDPHYTCAVHGNQFGLYPLQA